MVTDPIANYLTRLRNALQAQHASVTLPYSKVKEQITHILKDQGYIQDYQVEKNPTPQGSLHINLKYNPQTKKPAIVRLTRISTPGLRKYSNATSIPHVVNGLGIAILTTSKGIMTDKEARKQNVGGEILCYIY